MKLRCALIASFLLAASSHTLASKPVDLQTYLKLRQQWMTQLPFETLKANPASYVGKVFELRGTAVGFWQSGNGVSIIIDAGDKGSHVIDSDALPADSPGLGLACLVRIGEGSVHSLSDLKMVGCTYLADLKRMEERERMQAEARRKAEEAAKNAAAERAASQPTGLVSAEELVAAYAKAARSVNPRLTATQADSIARSILGFSSRYKVDPRLVFAVILAESNFRIDATSRAGAQGLGQLMPSTAAGLGVNNAYDPVENIYGSVRYIRSMLDRVAAGKEWNELSWYDLALALASYNAGPGAVKKYGGIPPYNETQTYVAKVTSIYKQLCGVD